MIIRVVVGVAVLGFTVLSEPPLGLGQPGLQGLESLTTVRSTIVGRLDDVGRQIAADAAHRQQEPGCCGGRGRAHSAL